MDISPDAGAGFCCADSQAMHAALCRRLAHESVQACLFQIRAGVRQAWGERER